MPLSAIVAIVNPLTNTDTTNATIFAVFLQSYDADAANSGPLYQTRDNNVSGFFPYLGSTGNQYVDYSGGAWMSQTSTFTPGVTQISTQAHTTNLTEIYQNGILSQSTANNTGTTGNMQIAWRNGSSEYFTGQIGEQWKHCDPCLWNAFTAGNCGHLTKLPSSDAPKTQIFADLVLPKPTIRCV